MDEITEYYYCVICRVRIQAVNGIGVGAFSPPVKFPTRALPPHPPQLECNGYGPNSLKLRWGDSKKVELVQYCVEMMKEGGRYVMMA